MNVSCRNKYIDGVSALKIIASILCIALLTGCAGKAGSGKAGDVADAEQETAADSHVDITKQKQINNDIFGWVYIPDTRIDCPVLQSGDGDDSFYISHNYLKEPDPKGAIFTESANLTNMCDFNEILHGNSLSDGTMFTDLNKFLDRAFFEEHPYIYFYMEGNALIYYTFAAYTRDNYRILEQYDMTNAYGCQEFLDEIYGSRSMNKNIRTGWENAVTPLNFIITLSTVDPSDPSRQIVVVGCLVGDVKGEINRDIDYSDPDSEW
jgi:sortase B